MDPWANNLDEDFSLRHKEVLQETTQPIANKDASEGSFATNLSDQSVDGLD